MTRARRFGCGKVYFRALLIGMGKKRKAPAPPGYFLTVCLQEIDMPLPVIYRCLGLFDYSESVADFLDFVYEKLMNVISDRQKRIFTAAET